MKWFGNCHQVCQIYSKTSCRRRKWHVRNYFFDVYSGTAMMANHSLADFVTIYNMTRFLQITTDTVSFYFCSPHFHYRWMILKSPVDDYFSRTMFSSLEAKNGNGKKALLRSSTSCRQIHFFVPTSSRSRLTWHAPPPSLKPPPADNPFILNQVYFLSKQPPSSCRDTPGSGRSHDNKKMTLFVEAKNSKGKEGRDQIEAFLCDAPSIYWETRRAC